MDFDLSVAQHETRAAEHARVGDVLLDRDEEWATVLYFYSAYHLIKAALLADPVFDDPKACMAKHLALSMQDRWTEAHKGRVVKGRRERWGVNDLVALLYKPLSAPYEVLHQASLEVRYGPGLLAGTPTDAQESLDKIHTDYHTGLVVAVP